MDTALTEDDLTGISYDALQSDDPRPFIAELVAVVEEGRLADPDDASYAFGLAADLAEGLHDGDLALSLSERSLEAARSTRDEHWNRARRADLLLRFGDEAEGMRELHALRPQLTRDETAALYVVDALTENGRAELAEEWLTQALITAAEIADRAEPDSEDAERAEDVHDVLARRRLHVRRELGLPPDEMDRYAEQVDDDEVADHLFWPEHAFTTLLERLPDIAEEIGATWDEHRARIERDLQESDPGDRPVVEVGTPDALVVLLGDDEGAVADPGPLLEWPPGRNEPCWCGSGTKYKKCCLPRGRT